MTAGLSGALWVTMLLHIWKAVPYNMVIFIARPGMIPAISVVLMLSFIRGFRVFAEVYATTGGRPSGATEMIMTHIYKLGFEQFDYGYA